MTSVFVRRCSLWSGVGSFTRQRSQVQVSHRPRCAPWDRGLLEVAFGEIHRANIARDFGRFVGGGPDFRSGQRSRALACWLCPETWPRARPIRRRSSVSPTLSVESERFHRRQSNRRSPILAVRIGDRRQTAPAPSPLLCSALLSLSYAGEPWREPLASKLRSPLKPSPSCRGRRPLRFRPISRHGPVGAVAVQTRSTNFW